jgi:hypothetical protein
MWTALVEIEVPATKFAGIGVRLTPELTSRCGARFAGVVDPPADQTTQGMLAASLSAPEASVEALHERELAALCVQTASQPAWGVLLHAQAPRAAWFARSYGLVLHNPFQTVGTTLLPTNTIEWGLSIVAYDAPGRDG